MNLLIAILFSFLQSNGVERHDIESDRRLAPKSYCGMYAVYGAVKVVLESEGSKIEKPFIR